MTLPRVHVPGKGQVPPSWAGRTLRALLGAKDGMEEEKNKPGLLAMVLTT